MIQQSNRFKGIVLVLLGAIFWGMGGTAADFLFEQTSAGVGWFVSARLLISGVLLLTIQAIFKDARSVFSMWKNKHVIGSFVLFSLLGMLLVQYSYMAAIDIGNAAIATLLQYLAPVYIVMWMIITRQQRAAGSDGLFILFTLAGTWLLLTNGSAAQLSVPPAAVVWGLISGVALAFYTLYAKKLLAQFPSLTVVGWAMVLAGVVINALYPVWKVDVSGWTLPAAGAFGFTVLFGTAIAFWLFVESLNYLPAKETTLIGTVEPVAAVVSSVIWMNLSFGPLQLVGMGMILLLVLMLSMQKSPAV